MKNTSNQYGSSTVTQRAGGGRSGPTSKRQQRGSSRTKSRTARNHRRNTGAQSGVEETARDTHGEGWPVRIMKGVDRLRFKSGRGYVERLTDTTAQINVRYTARSATPCPCQDDACTGLVKIGRYGESGDGSRLCLHCGLSPKSTTFYTSRSALARHVTGARCSSTNPMNANELAVQSLGEQLCYEVSNPLYLKGFKRAGQFERVFVCPKCGERPLWPDRFLHAVDCYPRHGVQLGGSSYPKVSDDDSDDSE